MIQIISRKPWRTYLRILMMLVFQYELERSYDTTWTSVDQLTRKYTRNRSKGIWMCCLRNGLTWILAYLKWTNPWKKNVDERLWKDHSCNIEQLHCFFRCRHFLQRYVAKTFCMYYNHTHIWQEKGSLLDRQTQQIFWKNEDLNCSQRILRLPQS